MSKVTKEYCDRCGKEIIKPVFPFLKFKVKVSATTLFGFGEYDYDNDDYTFCTQCSKDFKLFMKKERD